MKKVLAFVLALTMILSNMVFVVTAEDAASPSPLEESYTFTVFDESEIAYLVRTTAGANDRCRFSDATTETVYKFDIENVDAVSSVTFKATIGGQLLLQVSTDDVQWTDIYRFEKTEGNEFLDGIEREYDLTALLADAYGTMPSVVYIRVADSYTEDGVGGSICNDTPVTLTVTHESAARRYSFRIGETSEAKYSGRISIALRRPKAVNSLTESKENMT